MQDCQRRACRLSTVARHHPKANHPSGYHHRLLYLFVGLFPERAVKGLVLYTKVFANGKTHTETLLELGDMWPHDLAQLSFQQLVTQLFAASFSYQVRSAGCDSAQRVQVISRALVQGGDRQWKEDGTV